MHLAYSLVPLALALHSVCCAAADKPEPKIPADKSVNAAAAPAVGALGQPLSDLVPDIVRDIVSLFNEKERLTAEVALRYRDLNILVYATSPRSDDAGLAGSVCYSIDKPLAFWRNKEYRVCVLETGRFVFAGEDKCENRGYRGCTTQAGGKTVAFCRRVPGAPGEESSSTATTTTSRPSTTKRSTTSTKTSTGKPSTTSSRSKGTTASAEPTGGDPRAGATSTAPPPPPPVAPPTSAGGNANTGAATTGGQPPAGSTVGPAMIGVLAAVMVAFVAGALQGEKSAM
ncbi:hypothetical protein GGTG_05883 [Gaeumannomyces tritici R3-111a-1]|uniref:Uncharacterized protein n=1 Tax=Gaeumannomyces tritici (strain R3-111a-1) TaxID=644352 RepID=J3NX76_GAET3|nr:hypothetical protein GGTG_05883 [Gaeumannomyces tritici R3-111a-1]EJT75958.1 hypothetical protein GGTG_05883 [Gaeumannomyces tritici R3-111a-1]